MLNIHWCFCCCPLNVSILKMNVLFWFVCPIIARSPIYPYPYQSASGIQTIERPLMTASNSPFAQPHNAMAVSPMIMQHQPTFPTNLSTNQDNALANVSTTTYSTNEHFEIVSDKMTIFFVVWQLQLPQKEPNSIETNNIPFGQDSANFTPKLTNKVCDNKSSSSGSVVLRRTSNVAKQLGEDLIDLDNGVEDTWVCLCRYV